MSADPARNEGPRKDPGEPLPTFSYEEARVDRNYLRAFLEFQAIFANGYLWYATTSLKKWDVNYSWPVFRSKIIGKDFGLDTNHFGTNFVGHPLGGTGYYLTARGNRLGIFPSFLFSLAGSSLWELFGEVGEVISTNDYLVTPLAGLSIGEATTQLGAFFDRSAPTTLNRVLGATLGPFKSANDALDGVHLRRADQVDDLGFPANEWHRFDLSATGQVTVEDARATRPSSTWGESRFELSSDLARLAGYAKEANRSEWFSDGNLSSVSIEMTAGSHGFSDGWFTTRAVLVGYYERHAVRARGGISGGGTVVGMAAGFSYAVHDFDRERDGLRDRFAGIRPASLVVESRAGLRGVQLFGGLDAGPDFAGVRPFALPGYLAAHAADTLPLVTQLHGYYIGAGYHVTSTVGARIRDVELRARLRTDALWGLHSLSGTFFTPDSDVSFQDFRSVGQARLGYYFGKHGMLVLDGQRRQRLGKAGHSRAEAGEWSLGVGVQAVL